MGVTIRDFQNFQKLFPNDDACLEYIFSTSYSEVCLSCQKGKWYRVSGRKCYACSRCGKQFHPLAHTIFEKSSTPLTLWFYAIFIIACVKKPLTARDLENHLGVTYKTAWRMLKSINMKIPPREPRVDKCDGIKTFWTFLKQAVR